MVQNIFNSFAVRLLGLHEDALKKFCKMSTAESNFSQEENIAKVKSENKNLFSKKVPSMELFTIFPMSKIIPKSYIETCVVHCVQKYITVY